MKGEKEQRGWRGKRGVMPYHGAFVAGAPCRQLLHVADVWCRADGRAFLMQVRGGMRGRDDEGRGAR